MDVLRKLLVVVLTVAVTAALYPSSALAYQSLVGRADMDAAIESLLSAEEQARGDVRTLLEREDLRKLASSLGLGDARMSQAVAAVDVLDGEELSRVHAHAVALDHQLEGGATVQIGLVALLLIIIIVILIAK